MYFSSINRHYECICVLGCHVMLCLYDIRCIDEHNNYHCDIHRMFFSVCFIVSWRNVIHERENERGMCVCACVCLCVGVCMCAQKFRDLLTCVNQWMFIRQQVILWCVLNTINHFKTVQLNKLKTNDCFFWSLHFIKCVLCYKCILLLCNIMYY